VNLDALSRQRLFPWAASVLTALLHIIIFPRFELSWFAFLCFIPLLLLLKTESPWRLFLFGLLSGFIFNIGNLYWIYFVIQHYSSVPALVCVGILMLLCIVLALFWAIFLFLTGILRRGLGLEKALLIAPFLWTLLEWARSYTTQFPWCLFGYSQYNHLRIAQLASFAGVYGLSWILLAFNASIVMLVILRREYYFLAIASILIVVGVYGNFRIQQPIGKNTARIGLVQGNVPQDVKLNYKFGESIHRRHIDMTTDLLSKSKPDIIFWSEAATLFPLRDGGIWTEQIRELASSYHTPIIMGSDTFKGKEIFNSAYLVNEKGEIESQYDKVYLVPFGEFVPLKKIFFFAGKMVPEISDFTHGTNFEPFLIRGEKVSINICFEVVFPQLSREFCLRGATLLATITNDAWFGRTAAPYQHFAMAVMRAIENRRFIVRCANTGVSGFVDPYGRILQTTNVFVPAEISGEVRFVPEKTFYTQYGDWIVYLSIFVVGASLVVAFKGRRAAGDTK
jgi:apolipoprotein N-acyltransferase